MTVRFVPRLPWKCHVCGFAFELQNRFDGRRLVQTPNACPRCEAPVRQAPPVEHAIGHAKDLILSLVKPGADAVAALEQHVLDEAGVDRVVGAALKMDYRRWRAQLRSELADPEPDAREAVEVAREDLGAVERAVASPDLAARLRAVGDEVKERIAADRERHLAIAARYDARH